MIIEAIMLGILGYYHSWSVAIIVAVLVAFRRWPWLANQIAAMLELDMYDDMTAFVARHALPAWSGARSVMSRSEGAAHENGAAPVVVPVPGSLVPPGQTPDRDISKEGWIVKMAEARDEHGDYLFSANQIDKAIGAHRATTLEKIRAVRANTPPPQFRQDDGSTAPAEYPVTRSA